MGKERDIYTWKMVVCQSSDFGWGTCQEERERKRNWERRDIFIREGQGGVAAESASTIATDLRFWGLRK